MSFDSPEQRLNRVFQELQRRLTSLRDDVNKLCPANIQGTDFRKRVDEIMKDLEKGKKAWSDYTAGLEGLAP